jgi:hypothetical protein
MKHKLVAKVESRVEAPSFVTPNYYFAMLGWHLTRRQTNSLHFKKPPDTGSSGLSGIQLIGLTFVGLPKKSFEPGFT